MAGTRSRKRWQGLRLPQGAEILVSLFLLLFDALLLNQVFSLTFTLWLRSDPQIQIYLDSYLHVRWILFALYVSFGLLSGIFNIRKLTAASDIFFAHFKCPDRFVYRLQSACVLFARRGLLCLYFSKADFSAGNRLKHLHSLYSASIHYIFIQTSPKIASVCYYRRSIRRPANYQALSSSWRRQIQNRSHHDL